MKASQNVAFKHNLSLFPVKSTPERLNTPKKKIPNITFKSNDFLQRGLKRTYAKLNSSKDLAYQSNIINTEEFYKQDDSMVSLIEFKDSLQNNEQGYASFISRTISNSDCSNTVCQINEDLTSLFENKSTAANSLKLLYNVNFIL